MVEENSFGRGDGKETHLKLRALGLAGKRSARALVLGSHSSQTLVAAKSDLPDWSQTTVFF